MVDFVIRVVVSTAQAQQQLNAVDRRLNKLERTAKRTRASLSGLFNFAIIALAARQVGVLADEFTNLQNRIRVVATATTNLNRVTNELVRISNRTRSNLRATAELFTRTSLAVRELGLTERQVLGFTESLNQAIIISGASAREANAGLIQLSQGLASGVLRGDELRSVLEQLPVVADVIAKELGVTRGQLRDLGRDGQIASRDIIRAFQNAREELEERFAKTVPTIGQSFEVLRNQVISFIGALDSQTGILGRFSRLILLIAANVDILGESLLVLAGIILIQLARIAIPALIAVLKTLATSLLITLRAIAAPLLAAAAVAFFILAAKAAAAGTTIQEEFGNAIKFVSDGLSKLVKELLSAKEAISGFEARLSDAFGAALNLINADIPPTIDQINELTKTIETLRSEVEKELAFQQFFNPGDETSIALLQSQLSSISTLLNELSGEGLNLLPQQGFLDGFNEQLDQMIGKTQDVTRQFKNLGTEVATIFGPGGTLQEGISEAIADSIIFGKSFTGALRQIGKEVIASVVSALIKIGLQMGLNFLLGRTLAAATTSATVLQAGILTAALTVPATLASIASFGGAAVAGTAALGVALAASTGIVAAVSAGGGAIAGAGAGFADGGFVSGPGGPRSDSISARLSDGEFVVNAAATQRFRPVLESINAGSGANAGRFMSGGNTITFAPQIIVTEATVDPEDLARSQQEMFIDFLESEGQVGGRLEGQLR